LKGLNIPEKPKKFDNSIYKKKPTKVKPGKDTYTTVSRVLPLFVAQYHDFFDLVQRLKQLPPNYDKYVAHFKKKITCLARDIDV